MSSGAARTATGIRLSIARDPALVRTVRLVAAAVARRTSDDEELVEEVRLAVGEACGLLVGADAPDPGGLGQVEVEMTWDDRLRVRVRSTSAVPLADPLGADVDGMEPWSLLRGLIADLDVAQDRAGDDPGTVLTMSWPLPQQVG